MSEHPIEHPIEEPVERDPRRRRALVVPVGAADQAGELSGSGFNIEVWILSSRWRQSALRQSVHDRRCINDIFPLCLESTIAPAGTSNSLNTISAR